MRRVGGSESFFNCNFFFSADAKFSSNKTAQISKTDSTSLIRRADELEQLWL